MYKIFFYNLGFTKGGFKTWQDAFEHLKDCCYEGAVYDEEEVMVLSWSPISGLIWGRNDYDSSVD